MSYVLPVCDFHIGSPQGITNVNSMMVIEELHRNAELSRLTSVGVLGDDMNVMNAPAGSLLKGTNTSIWSERMRAKLAASKNNATAASKPRGAGEQKLHRDNYKRGRQQIKQDEMAQQGTVITEG